MKTQQMQPLEAYLENADALAQDVVNAWGVNVSAGNASDLTPEFRRLLDKACRYRTAKSIADNHREFNVLTDAEETELQTARLEFAEEYKVFHEKHTQKDNYRFQQARLERLAKVLSPGCAVHFDPDIPPTSVRMRVNDPKTGTILMVSSGHSHVSEIENKSDEEIKQLMRAWSGGKL